MSSQVSIRNQMSDWKSAYHTLMRNIKRGVIINVNFEMQHILNGISLLGCINSPSYRIISIHNDHTQGEFRNTIS